MNRREAKIITLEEAASAIEKRADNQLNWGDDESEKIVAEMGLIRQRFLSRAKKLRGRSAAAKMLFDVGTRL